MGQRLIKQAADDGEEGDDFQTNFPFLRDKKTLKIMESFNIMFILRGLPGSGKSTLSCHIMKSHPYAKICSADYYFQRDGVYQFDKTKLKDAHQWCQDITKSFCSQGVRVIIIDNTNITLWEVRQYFRIANKNSYIVMIVEPKTPWKFNPEELSKRTKHNVAVSIIQARLKQYVQIIPIYFGLFLSEKESFRIIDFAGQVYRSCLKVPIFIGKFCNVWMDINYKDPFQYFIKVGHTLHCTTKYCNQGTEPGSQFYFKQKFVQESCGKRFQLKIVGFTITPRTFGARVKLGEQELHLWNQNDQISDSQAPVSVSRLNSTAALVSILANLSLNDATSIYIDSGLRLSKTIVIPSQKPTRFQPTMGIGRRAHLTLGCSEGTKPVQTGFDQLDLIRYEEEIVQTKTQLPTFAIPEGILRFYDNGCWAIFLDTPITCDCMFAGFY